MATLAQISRRLLPRTLSTTLSSRSFSAEAAQSARNRTKPDPIISESPVRVKWDYRGQRKMIPLGQWAPKIAVDAYVAPNVVLAGQVVVYDGASVWNGAVLRGDLNKISVGFCSNVQEQCVIHAAWSSPTGPKFSLLIDHLSIGSFLETPEEKPLTGRCLLVAFAFPWGTLKLSSSSTLIGTSLPAETLIDRFVTIGACSLLRSCTVEPECIIGQRSILMEGSLVETHSILEAGSVVPPGRRIPSGELWAGNPAKFVRALTHEETLDIPKLAVAINDLSKSYFSEFLPYSTVYLEVEKLKSSLGVSI
ncbi:gamma carbonic anhydrase-like 1 mitochondrial [Phtheirospermum japonicum]|uniref:Gamma carbonic anhydrase-like 1 mitochondrial n=1 Tax=Phtheirospermum japonicum TaxID=374723 RepID=A0A830CVY6_9LAMI|nr:gamma carbonic anhydrase-like 1 mitochondrial [Phtheirospermum japonicum]